MKTGRLPIVRFPYTLTKNSQCCLTNEKLTLNIEVDYLPGVILLDPTVNKLNKHKNVAFVNFFTLKWLCGGFCLIQVSLVIVA